MKKTQKIALCGVLSAMAVVINLLAYFPYLTYALPAIAGVVFIVITIEAGRKWAFGSYIAASLITLLLCEKESGMLFVCFFGYYTILKGIIEQYTHGFLEHLIKQAVFSVAAAIAYVIIVNVMGIPLDETGQFGVWFPYLLLAVGNVVFAVYDVGLNRIIGLYINAYHPKIRRFFK